MFTMNTLKSIKAALDYQHALWRFALGEEIRSLKSYFVDKSYRLLSIFCLTSPEANQLM